MSKQQRKTRNLIFGAMFLAIAIILPSFTMQIPEVGNMLLPMHLPVLICGFFCGPVTGAIVGLVAPLLRFLLFGMPPIVPTGISMCFELATYGVMTGLLYRAFPRKNAFIYAALIIAMVTGRVVWAGVRLLLLGVNETPFTWTIFLAEGFVNAIPGIIIQLVLVPLLVIVLRKFAVE